MADLDAFQREEDDTVLSGFIYQVMGGRRSPVFSKVAVMDQDIVSSIHEKWSASASEKIAVMEWHRDNTESRHQDFIDLLFEAEEVGMTERIIEMMEYAYNERIATSVEQLYQALELQAKEHFPMEMAVHLSTSKSAEEIEKDIEARQEEAEERQRTRRESKITMGNLQRKWDKASQDDSTPEMFR